ncbi:MAG: penicillin-binding protein activator LpoB [Fuerstiella sp.]|nr:penicillin-binding protein activator LpoB [Fuerstiella sp.]
MDTRPEAWTALLVVFGTFALIGCRSHQHARILSATDKDMVGSHEAGAATWKPLIDESVVRLLGRSVDSVETVSYTTSGGVPVRTVCFAGVENRSSEPLGDFREQIYEHIDSLVGQSPGFRMISRRYVEAAMKDIRCRPDALILPANQRQLQAALERVEQPFDYLLFAQVTSGTTETNGDYQRDYLLTLELLDIHTGVAIKESAQLRKGYHRSYVGKLRYKLMSSP